MAAASVKALGGALAAWAQRRAGSGVGNAERARTLAALLERGRGAAAAELANAAVALRIREIEQGVADGVLVVARALLQLAPLLAALAVLSTPLAALATVALAPFALALSWLRRRLRARHAAARQQSEALHASVDELVRHVDLWRTYGAGARVQRRIAVLGHRAGRTAARVEAARAALSGANEALGALVLLAVVATAAYLGRADSSALVAFCVAFFLLYRPLRDLAEGRTQADRGAIAAEELDRLFALPAPTASVPAPLSASVPAPAPAPVTASTSHAPLSGTRRLSPRAVPAASHIAWPLARLEIDAVHVDDSDRRTPPTTLVAEPGEIVAVIGPTGAGKSTLLRALLGLEPTARGSIRYAGVSLDGAPVGPVARPFAWVPQEPAIIAGTIEDNIALALAEPASTDPASIPAFARARISRTSLESIGADSLLASRADDTVSAGGPELSGGERQWLAIARALASGQPVLLLDEPTAGLDPVSQSRVLTALAALRGQRTILLVTHRPEPQAIADRILDLAAAPPPPLRATA
ncbi:MAG: ATP-binding cassette domain-containing protein [Polyangiaceae bacterium]